MFDLIVDALGTIGDIIMDIWDFQFVGVLLQRKTLKLREYTFCFSAGYIMHSAEHHFRNSQLA